MSGEMTASEVFWKNLLVNKYGYRSDRRMPNEKQIEAMYRFAAELEQLPGLEKYTKTWLIDDEGNITEKTG